MKCFNHNEIEAVGICKACNKGICLDCAEDTGNGLACKDKCIGEVKEINEIVERSKQIYGIGKKSASFSSGVIVYFIFAILFIGWGVFYSARQGRLDLFPFIMGAGFLIIAGFIHYKHRKLKINC